MKKFLLFFTCFSLFFSCSKDEESEIKFQIHVNELVMGSTMPVGKYYLSSTTNLFIPFASEIEYGIDENDLSGLRACDAFCPNWNEKHELHPNYYLIVSMNSDNTFSFYCPQCNAKYEMKTGKPLNDKAGNKRLDVYHLSYDTDKKLYIIWK